MREGEQVVVEITGINHDGEGVGRVGGAVVFLPGTVPGERVAVRISELRRNYARGVPLQILTPSQHREEPACGLSVQCGGCSLQHVAYKEQLRLKTELVRQNLARIGGVAGANVREMIGMDDPWHYRNNVRFKVRRYAGGVALGFFAPESHRLVAGMENGGGDLCLLAHRELNRVAAAVREILENTPAGAGLPEEVMLRRGGTGEIMVVLVGNKGEARGFNQLGLRIAGIPRVVSVMALTRAGGKKPGGRYKVLAGRDYILDELDGLVFRISAASFYQVNPRQTRVLYRRALEYCALRGGEEVADAYCGVGTITLYVARYAGAARGYEVVPRAVEDARANAALNGSRNVHFFQGAVERVLPEHVAGGYRPGVVLLDPPRAGCRPEVLDAVARSGARRVVYVSCNPATLARDIGRLARLGYELQEVQPVDMFPHTSHCEVVARIERVKG